MIQSTNSFTDKYTFLIENLKSAVSKHQECVQHNEEVLQITNLLDSLCIHLNDYDVDFLQFKNKNENLQQENQKITEELIKIRDKFRESQAQIATLIKTNSLLNKEIVEYKKRFELVKNILKVQNSCDLTKNLNSLTKNNAIIQLMNLSFLKNETTDDNSSIDSIKSCYNSQADIDYDKTNETCVETPLHIKYKTPINSKNFKLRNRNNRLIHAKLSKQNLRRRYYTQKLFSYQNHTFKRFVKIPEEKESEKRSNNESLSNVSKETKEFDLKTSINTNNLLVESKKENLQRSLSKKNSFNVNDALCQRKTGFTSITRIIRNPITEFKHMWTRGRPISECFHAFRIEKFNWRSVCAVCLKSFTCFKCFRCNDCKCAVHQWCISTAPIPCVPAVKTPQKNQKNRPRLVDFCPETRPKIPVLIVRCVVALEKNFLNTVGLYRIPGAETKKDKLFKEFYSNNLPNLYNREPETICSCIKKFLRELREPLIPTSSYCEFIRAVENKRNDQLMCAINELPIPNRDTLAFLCLHLQKVAKNSNINKMSFENLASCLGPTIVGSKNSPHSYFPESFSCQNKTSRQRSELEVDARRQIEVLLSMLKLKQRYWENLLNSLVVNNGFTLNKKLTLALSTRQCLYGLSPSINYQYAKKKILKKKTF